MNFYEKILSRGANLEKELSIVCKDLETLLKENILERIKVTPQYISTPDLSIDKPYQIYTHKREMNFLQEGGIFYSYKEFEDAGKGFIKVYGFLQSSLGAMQEKGYVQVLVMPFIEDTKIPLKIEKLMIKQGFSLLL